MDSRSLNFGPDHAIHSVACTLRLPQRSEKIPNLKLFGVRRCSNCPTNISKSSIRSWQEEKERIRCMFLVRQGIRRMRPRCPRDSGCARVVKVDQNGKEIALATMKPGDSFVAPALSEVGHPHRHCSMQYGGRGLRPFNRVDFLQLAEENARPQHRDHAAILAGAPWFPFTSLAISYDCPSRAAQSGGETKANRSAERRIDHPAKAIPPARCSFWRKGGRGLFNQ